MGRTLRVEADGGSRGNPGVAGYGALVRDEAGTVLVELAAPIGTASNNVAEYRGMLAGLAAAHRISADAEVVVAMDSQLVVEQMAGRWKVKHPDMRALAQQGRDLVARIVDAGGSVDFVWVPRADNSAADALSNRGMDGDEVEDWHADEQERDDLAPSRDGEQEPARPWSGRGTPTRVVLVRHGVTAFTEQGRLDGRGGYDPDLTDAGRRQAQRAADLVAGLVGDDPVQVLTSDLARGRQTGAVIAERLGTAIEVDRDWDEQSFGDWDGAAVRDLVKDAAEDFRALRDDRGYARPGGESHDEMVERVLGAWERVVARGGTVVVASHRKPILAVLGLVLGLPHESMWRIAGSPGSLTGIEAWPDGQAVVAFTNRT
ncbi:bifunctional RNase H/acid phosphatase [Janibacter indicus]|uniref:Bifunctional RNase H/acid phosphatase n=1 Tax=Janibacter indicus TaxID=857417 RepID=A0A7L9IXV7_9MICO|nr:bifunctional RNase H/acid phosphatase [Janibacter indicus]QOK21613.1 bifunctional RNase H/acid phosphatase [Janibacter indicus]